MTSMNGPIATDFASIAAVPVPLSTTTAWRPPVDAESNSTLLTPARVSKVMLALPGAPAIPAGAGPAAIPAVLFGPRVTLPPPLATPPANLQTAEVLAIESKPISYLVMVLPAAYHSELILTDTIEPALTGAPPETL